MFKVELILVHLNFVVFLTLDFYEYYSALLGRREF